MSIEEMICERLSGAGCEGPYRTEADSKYCHVTFLDCKTNQIQTLSATSWIELLNRVEAWVAVG